MWECLEYAKRIEKRNVLPISEICLGLYKNATERALLTQSYDKRQLYSVQFLSHEYDKVIHHNDFLYREQQQFREDDLLKPEKLE